MPDPFSTLGVARTCSADDIKSAFRKLALQLHPDRLSSEPEHVRQAASTRFKAITEAYEILSDDSKRASLQRGGSTYAAGGAYGSGSRQHGYAYGHGSAPGGPSADAHWWHNWHAGGGGPRKARRTLWHSLTRSLSMRPLEVAFFAALAGMAGVGIWGIDTLWAWRNKGRQFEDIQRNRHSLMGWSSEQQAALQQQQPAGQRGATGDEGATSPAPRQQAQHPLRGFVPSGCGVRSKPYAGQFPGVDSRAVSDLPLSQLMELEAEEERQAARRPGAGAAAAAGGGGKGA